MLTRILGSMIVTLSLICTAFAGGYSKDIIDTDSGADFFQTPVAAIKAAGLVGARKGDGPFTVFAQADNTFKALPEGTLETLLKPKNRPIAILTYHVLAGKVMASDIGSKKLEVTMVNVTTAEVDTTDGVKIDGANVIQVNIEISTGVVHVIDAAILT